MRTPFSRYSFLLLLGLVALVLSSCAGLAVAADPPPKVTPDTTNPSTLRVTVTIDDDENATDGKVGITMQFATDEIKDANYIEFAKGEKVLCNSVQLAFNDPNYTARVSKANQKNFRCEYKWNGGSYPIIFPVRKSLSPHLEINAKNNNFVIDHTPEYDNSCSITVDLIDSSSTISTNVTNQVSDKFTVAVNSLSGVGSLIMTRTCLTNLKGIHIPSDAGNTPAVTPFAIVSITYKSISRLYETWEPPA
jgi:hypothetical protein